MLRACGKQNNGRHALPFQPRMLPQRLARLLWKNSHRAAHMQQDCPAANKHYKTCNQLRMSPHDKNKCTHAPVNNPERPEQYSLSVAAALTVEQPASFCLSWAHPPSEEINRRVRHVHVNRPVGQTAGPHLAVPTQTFQGCRRCTSGRVQFCRLQTKPMQSVRKRWFTVLEI